MMRSMPQPSTSKCVVPKPVMASVEPARAVARLFEESWGVESRDEADEPMTVSPAATTTVQPRASHVA